MAAAIEFDSQTLNLYGIRKYFEAEERAVRATAFRAYSDIYRAHKVHLEEIWGEFIAIRNEMGHAFAGYITMRSQPLKDFFSKSTDILEIHSMAMEQFACPYAGW